MKNKNILKVGIIIVIIIIAVIISFVTFNNSDKDKYVFNIDTINKYKIITDMRWNTMRNDGGSNTNLYYNVDLDNNMVYKIVEDYQANLGGKSKTTTDLIYKKEIDNSIANELKQVLVEIMEKEDINETKNYNFYTIVTLNNEKNIHNINSINEIENVLKRLDEI